MGCFASMKVKPITENPKASENGNRIKGDRLSIVDARLRRETESQNRLRRLSSLAPEEVNKVRRNSSRQSTPNVHSVPEEEPQLHSQHVSSRENTPPNNINSKKKKKKTRKKRASTLKESELEASYQLDEEKNDYPHETQVMKINGYQYDSKNSKRMENRLEIDHNNSMNNISHSSVQEVMLTQRFTENESDSDVTTELPVPTTLNNKHISRDQHVNQSMDSLELKANANLFVNDIMSRAIFEVKRNSIINDGVHDNERKHQSNSNGEESKRSVSTDRNNGSNFDESRRTQQNSGIGHTTRDSGDGESTTNFLPGCVNNADEDECKREKEAADKRARSVVDQILSNALFVVKNENT